MRTASGAQHRADLKRGTIAVAALVAACGLIGCAQVRRAVDIQPPPVNPSSPIAAYAEGASKTSYVTPDFQQVPPKPTDVRPPAAYKLAVLDEIRLRRQLAAWRATHPELTSDTEAWADFERHRIPTSATPVSSTQDAESEAFAKRLREEAAKATPQ